MEYKRNDRDGNVILDIRVTPNAPRTQVDGVYAGGGQPALKIRLHAPPVDGKANEALISWLARQLGIPQKSVELISGKTSRRKQLRLSAEAAAKADWEKIAAAAAD